MFYKYALSSYIPLLEPFSSLINDDITKIKNNRQVHLNVRTEVFAIHVFHINRKVIHYHDYYEVYHTFCVQHVQELSIKYK